MVPGRRRKTTTTNATSAAATSTKFSGTKKRSRKMKSAKPEFLGTTGKYSGGTDLDQITSYDDDTLRISESATFLMTAESSTEIDPSMTVIKV